MYIDVLVSAGNKKKKKKRHRGHGDEARAFDLSTFGKCFEICIYLYRRIFNFGT